MANLSIIIWTANPNISRKVSLGHVGHSFSLFRKQSSSNLKATNLALVLILCWLDLLSIRSLPIKNTLLSFQLPSSSCLAFS